jgi:transposase
VQALYLLKTRQIETVQHLAVCLGRDRVTVQRWLRQYRQGGLQEMLAVGKSKGRPKAIPDWAIKRLQQELSDPEGSIELQRSADLVGSRLGHRSQLSYRSLFGALQT